MHKKRFNCRLCGSENPTKVVDMRPIPVSEHYLESKPLVDAERYSIDIYQCTACSGVQTQDDIDPEFLWKDYTYYSGQTSAIIRHFEDVAREASLLAGGLTGKLVFDIGSNDGTLLKAFQNHGARGWGIDPADSVVRVARKSGVKTYQGLFTRSAIDAFDDEDRFADIVTACNVFAHSADMPEMCRAVAKILKDDGIFLFEVQYLGDISKRKILGTFFHEHMVHYSAISAQNFLKLHNLKIFHYLKNDIQMGSVIFCAAHTGNQSRLETPDLHELLEHEKTIGLNSDKWAREFVYYVEENRKMAIDFANTVTTNGYKVAAYGAARSGPSLLIQFGIDFLVDVIFDDHRDKVRKYSPFRGLEVLPTLELKAADYKYCVVTAYIHLKTILLKLSDYLASGGYVVALWPKFTVISLENRDKFLMEFGEWRDAS